MFWGKHPVAEPDLYNNGQLMRKHATIGVVNFIAMRSGVYYILIRKMLTMLETCNATITVSFPPTGYILRDRVESCSSGWHFSRSTLPRCLYFESFKSYKALNLTIANKNSQKRNLFGLTWSAPEDNSPNCYIFGKLPSKHETLRFTVFDIITVKWLSERPKFQPNPHLGLAFGDSSGYNHQTARRGIWDRPPSQF